MVPPTNRNSGNATQSSSKDSASVSPNNNNNGNGNTLTAYYPNEIKPPPDASFYQRPFPKGLLNTNNFDRVKCVRWRNLKLLRIEHCEKEMNRIMIASYQDTLSTVDFCGLTSFKNVHLIFQTCLNLEVIYFTNIILSFYTRDTKCICSLPHVYRVVFYGIGALTKDENAMLDFFHRRVKFESLNTLSFEPKYPEKIYTGSRNLLTDVSPLILSEFLAKIRFVLKNLEVNRSAITLFDEDNKSKARNINLIKLVGDMDSQGIQLILNNQNQLQSLHCYSSKNLNEDAFHAACLCIKRCRRFLRDIRFDYKALADEDDKFTGTLYHDCSTYKDCEKLRKLSLNLSIVDSIEDPNQNQVGPSTARGEIMRPGGLQNLHQLPIHLTNIIIRFDIAMEDDLDLLFIDKIKVLRNLKFFLFHGNLKSAYLVKLSYIESLLSLKKLQVFELCYCQLEDLQALLDYRDSKPSLIPKLGITLNSCIYWKNRQ